jgi:lysyl-tRNA synthetase class 2
MKRLIAAGAERIYQITRSFRAGESGRLHNPEFTIVEWYRVGDSMRSAMELLADLTREMLSAERVETVSYEDAFLRLAGIHPHTATLDELQNRTRQLRLNPPDRLESHRDAWLNFLLAERVEPQLGLEHPLILYDYPATQAALSRLRWTHTANEPDATTSYPVAERFELYYRGIELANGYHELLDPAVLRQRNEEANAGRRADGRYTLPADSRLLAAMDFGLPPCSGVALGFDRLVALAAGASSLAEVMPFPLDRA